MSTRPRRLWFILGAVLAGLVGLALGAFVGLPGMVERAAAGALAKLEQRLGVEVHAARVDWTWGGAITLEGLRVTSAGMPLVEAPRAALDLDIALWDRHVRPVALHLDTPTFYVRRDRDGRLNVSELLQRLRAGGGGIGGRTGGVTIEPVLPTIAMEHASVQVDAKLPGLPFGLTIPERLALRDGLVTVLAEPGRDDAYRIDARFADTTVDPGYGLQLVAVLSKAAGPERLEANVARPIRFYLGDRVVGFGGVAWSPAGVDASGAAQGGALELAKLQLSVPLSKTQGGVVPAAATCERLTLRPEPLTLLQRAGASDVAKLLAAVDTIELTRPIVALEVDAEGRHSFQDLLQAEAGVAGGPRPARGPRDESLSRVAVGASLAASDRLLAASGAKVAEPLATKVQTRLEALVRASEQWVPRAAHAVDKLFMKTVAVTGGELMLDLAGERIDLAGVDATARVVDGTKELTARFALGDDGGRFAGRAALDASGPAPRLEIHVAGTALPLAWVPPGVLAALRLGPDGALTTYDVTFAGPVSGRAWDVSGEIVADDLVFTHAAIARDPLRDLDLGWKGRVSLDADAGRLSIAETRLRSKQLVVTLDADIADALRVPRIHAKLDLPETPVQTVVDALPAAVLSLLDGLRVDGSLRWAVDIDLDTAKPAEIVLKSEPVLTGFGVVSMGTRIDFNDLRGAHSYRIRLGDGTPGTRLVGPMTGSWVPLEGITPYLPAALTTTEDGTFYTNDGVSTFAMRESLATNLERGSFVRGASTITQQLVKNLYLGGEKTVARKLQELFIAWQMTKALSKGEIMALYLNTIEFAPGIYGIGDAAWYYFGKRPYQLDLTEAIFLASIVPGPRRYHYFFEEGQVTERWRNYLRALLQVMVDRTKISAEEMAAAAPYDPHFRGSDRPPPDGETPPDDFDAPPDDPEPEPE